MRQGTNVTFILKEPSGKLHYERIDPRFEPLDVIHRFSICPNISQCSSTSMSDDSGEGSLFGFGSTQDYFSIKNNCKTPYCTKLINEWSPYKDVDIKSLSYVTIKREFFDPIVDPDLIDDDYTGSSSSSSSIREPIYNQFQDGDYLEDKLMQDEFFFGYDN